MSDAKTSIGIHKLASELERQARRLDSKLESEGAEFLVLGLLLVEGIQATKAYTRFPGYDLLAFSPERNRVCRIQVKSRWATDYDKSFPIKNFDCDFVVHVALNRGYRHRKRLSSGGRQPPLVYVLPVDVVRKAQSPKSTWGKVFLRSMADVEQYIDNWDLIRAFLKIRPVQ
jgi:hypothetical protein